MSDPEAPQTDEPTVDPKEAMRLALERKKAAEHGNLAGGIHADKTQGHAQKGAAGKRQFRRKSGG